MLVVAAGCSGPATPASGRTAAPDSAASLPPAEGPCSLLALVDVQRAFPGSEPGRLDRRQEQSGSMTCVWVYPTGRFSIIAGNEAPQPAIEEARGWTLMFRDPLKPDAERHVRYERVEGAGDEAIAVVEPADASKGFIEDGALLVIRKGNRQITMMSTDLARRGRLEAMRTLAALGAAVANRLH